MGDGNLYIYPLTTINNMAKKLLLDCEDNLWNEVLKYKIDKGLKNNNEAVIDLIKKGLKQKRVLRTKHLQ